MRRPARLPRLFLAGLLLAALWLAGLAATARAEQPDWTALEDEAVRRLSRYLQIDTTNPPGDELRAAEFFARWFEQEGIEAKIYESAPGRGNVVARLPGDGSEPSVVLMHHMDVVPADARYWQHEPFGGAIADGEIWGRGALDDKGMGIASAVALIALARSGAPLGGDVVFLGVADEEAGGALGAGFLVANHFELFADAGVVLNEGGYIALGEDGAPRFYAVEVAQKIPFWLRLTAKGTPGHGSMPLPDAAPARLLAALGRITAWQTPLRVVPQLQRFYADTAAGEPAPRREKLRDLGTALADPAFAAEFTAVPRQNAQVRNTISLTVLEGSSKTNVIPPEAHAELDVRLLPDQDPQAFLAELEAVIDDPGIAVETLLSFPPSSSPSDHELFNVLGEIAERRHPGTVVTTPLAVGFTDCHYFRERGIPCYGFMPFALGEEEGTRIHGNDERIAVPNLKRGTRLLYEITAKLAGAEEADPASANVAGGGPTRR